MLNMSHRRATSPLDYSRSHLWPTYISHSDTGSIRELLPLSAEGTIPRKYQQHISRFQEDVTDRAKTHKVISDYIKQSDPFPEFLLCTICTDAFTVDPNLPKTKSFIDGDGGPHQRQPGVTIHFLTGAQMSPVFRQVLPVDLIFLYSQLFSTSSQQNNSPIEPLDRFMTALQDHSKSHRNIFGQS
jgi:hypothetical protein